MQTFALLKFLLDERLLFTRVDFPLEAQECLVIEGSPNSGQMVYKNTHGSSRPIAVFGFMESDKVWQVRHCGKFREILCPVLWGMTYIHVVDDRLVLDVYDVSLDLHGRCKLIAFDTQHVWEHLEFLDCLEAGHLVVAV